MAIGTPTTGTKTLSGSNQLLALTPAPGTYTLYVDCSTMASGDTVVFQIEVNLFPTLSLGGQFVQKLTLSGAQAVPVAKIECVAVPFQGGAFAQQTATGTFRSVPWCLVRVDGTY